MENSSRARCRKRFHMGNIREKCREAQNQQQKAINQKVTAPSLSSNSTMSKSL